MLPSNLTTAREVTRHYNAVYTSLVDSGQAVPFLYPWAGLGAFAIIAYLLIDHRQNAFLRWLRFPLVAALAVFQGWCILTNKARHPAAAFGVGLLSAWGVFWVSTFMFVNDCQTDFVRVERRDVVAGSGTLGRTDANGDVSNDSMAGTNLNGKDDSPRNIAPQPSLYWQPYPSTFGATRIDWVADLFCSFRGVGWSFQTTTVPPIPRPAMLRIPDNIPHANYKALTISRTGIRRFRDPTVLLYTTLTNLAIDYILLDILKCLMHHDPYFWGYTHPVPPAPTYLPNLIRHSPFLLKSYRLLLSLAGIHTALHTIFALGPLTFSHLLSPTALGLRGEAWMNPADMYGAFSLVLDAGLSGWWGGWWHQVFRVAFEAHSKALLRTLRIDPRSQNGKLVGLGVAFAMSGCLHACGSYTQLGETRPLLGPMRFFLLQPVGIVVQMQMVRLLRTAGFGDETPRVLKRLGNLAFVGVWLYYTAPLLADDFAKGGIWLFEPIAFSPLRALGFGAKDDGFFCWWDGIVFWRSGRHWWDTGIAV